MSGSADYSEISDIQSSGVTPHATATASTVPIPNGGGTFVYAAHSLANTPGVTALYNGEAGFAPTTKAGDLASAVYKGGAGGSGFSSYLFVNLNGQASTNTGYILGLSDSEPAHLELRKGTLATGLPDVAPGTSGVLRRSTATYALGTWVQVRLEVILEPTGDVVMNVYQSDLVANVVTSPVWAAVPGMAPFTDDVLQINTGSAPLPSGRMGFGMTCSEINRIAAWDQIDPKYQITP